MLGKYIKVKVARHHFNINLPEVIQGKVIFENDSFITIQTEHYPTTIDKFDLISGKAVMLHG